MTYMILSKMQSSRRRIYPLASEFTLNVFGEDWSISRRAFRFIDVIYFSNLKFNARDIVIKRACMKFLTSLALLATLG